MKKMAFLEYAFIFDEGTFGNLYDFENLLGKAFKAAGYNANVIDTVKGFSGRRIVYIDRTKDILEDPKKTFRNKEPIKKPLI